MNIAYITAGAAGMFCGSCMHDNTLVAALRKAGHDALLIPTYTPIRTDEVDVSQGRLFFGGINVYLEQKVPLFRRTPWFIDRLLNGRWLLNLVSGFAARTRAEQLGDLTLSVLRGEHGFQRKEIDKLVSWLQDEVRPEIINLTNVLLSGMVPPLKERLKIPVVATLQGDDIFLEALPRTFRAEAKKLIRENCQQVDGYIATSRYYADFMASYLDLPRDQIAVVYPGLNLHGFDEPRPRANGEPFTVGYFARICPEKGLHVLVDAFRLLKQQIGDVTCRLQVSGWLGEHNKPYFEELQGKLKSWGLQKHFVYVESPDHASKVAFLREVDVLSVPTVYREPKGLYVLEALAAGVPVVQPEHGSFPELLAATGGGLLVRPEDPDDLARALRQLLEQPDRRSELGRQGHEAVLQRFQAGEMARATAEVYGKYLQKGRRMKDEG
jgi:glycosyltransferase involved in cell wall biosynthesis